MNAKILALIISTIFYIAAIIYVIYTNQPTFAIVIIVIAAISYYRVYNSMKNNK